MTNRIIKVYGHHRSGNNYMCALLFKNFYSGYDGLAKEIQRDGRRFFLFGEEIQEDTFTHPYFALWGGHDPSLVTRDSIYVIRSWDAVERSLQKRTSPVPRQWAGDLPRHVDHIYLALTHRPFVVYYEELKEDPAQVLSEIQQHFHLFRLYRDYITDVGYCGWPE